MAKERESRKWWVVTDNGVTESIGWSCAPDNPTYWWFPGVGISAGEGHHVFANRASAVAKARQELIIEISRLTDRLEKLV